MQENVRKSELVVIEGRGGTEWVYDGVMLCEGSWRWLARPESGTRLPSGWNLEALIKPHCWNPQDIFFAEAQWE